MENLLLRATENIKSINAIMEEYMTSGELSQQQKWKLVETWRRSVNTNDVVEYAVKRAEESPNDLYADIKQLLNELKNFTALRESNKSRYMSLKFSGEGDPSWKPYTFQLFWESMDMDLFDYLIKKYCDIASAIISDIKNYWRENNIEPMEE